MNTAVLTADRTVETMRQQLVDWSALNGVTPERMLVMRGAHLPVWQVIQFAWDAGLCLPAVLQEFDRLVEYIGEANA